MRYLFSQVTLAFLTQNHLLLCCRSFTLAVGPKQCIRHVACLTRCQSTVYDNWRADGIIDTLYLCPEHIEECLDEFLQSDYGATVFGCHERPASIGITGKLSFVDVQGPAVTLALEGEFWHKRTTVLGRAAVWLNARIPEITDVTVADRKELEDFEDILDECSGEVLYTRDKRAPDFNGDRSTMEYQGLDPDVRGPFPQGPMGSGASMISPA